MLCRGRRSRDWQSHRLFGKAAVPTVRQMVGVILAAARIGLRAGRAGARMAPERGDNPGGPSAHGGRRSPSSHDHLADRERQRVGDEAHGEQQAPGGRRQHRSTTTSAASGITVDPPRPGAQSSAAAAGLGGQEYQPTRSTTRSVHPDEMSTLKPPAGGPAPRVATVMLATASPRAKLRSEATGSL